MSTAGDTNRLVLYADDDPDDRMLLTETFRTVAPDYILETVADGFAALDYLKNKIPCLLVLDLNMPGMSGKDVLLQLRQQAQYQSLPVVIFTTSSSPADRLECTRLGVDMITKPIDLRAFEQTASRLLTYCS